MSYDPQWKEKLEAKRAARSVPPVLPASAAAEKKKGPGVLVGCLAVLGGGVVLLFGAAMVKGFLTGMDRAAQDRRPPGAPAVAEAPAEAVTVDQLLANVGNQVAWDRKWKGRRVRVSGPLHSVNSSFAGGGGHLQIGTDLKWVQIRFGAGQDAAVGELVIGQEVTISGKVEAVVLGWPQLADGRVEK